MKGSVRGHHTCRMLIGAFDDSSTSFDVGSIQGVDHTITCNPNGDHVLPEMIFRHSKGDLSDNLIQMGPSAFLALADKVLHFYIYFLHLSWPLAVQWYHQGLRALGKSSSVVSPLSPCTGKSSSGGGDFYFYL